MLNKSVASVEADAGASSVSLGLSTTTSFTPRAFAHSYCSFRLLGGWQGGEGHVQWCGAGGDAVESRTRTGWHKDHWLRT